MNREYFGKLILKGQIERAFQELNQLDRVKRESDISNSLLLSESRFNRNNKDFKLGVIPHSQYTIEYNRICQALQSVFDEIFGSIDIKEKNEPKKNDDMPTVESETRYFTMLWNKVRFQGFSSGLKTDLKSIKNRLEEYQRNSIGNSLYDLDGIILNELNKKIIKFNENHSLEFNNFNKIQVGKLVELVEKCENDPSLANATTLANQLYLYDATIDFRERLESVKEFGQQAIGNVLNEMAKEVERLWNNVK